MLYYSRKFCFLLMSQNSFGLQFSHNKSFFKADLQDLPSIVQSSRWGFSVGFFSGCWFGFGVCGGVFVCVWFWGGFEGLCLVGFFGWWWVWFLFYFYFFKRTALYSGTYKEDFIDSTKLMNRAAQF